MAEELGSGILLDEQFDFEVDTTGDLDSEGGIQELQKDLAFQMVISLSQYIGQPPTGNLKEQVAATAKRVALADSRVITIESNQTNVSFSEDREEIRLRITARTIDGQANLVFDV